MIMLGFNSWAGGHGSTNNVDPTPPKPATIQDSVSQPLTNAQQAVTQLPESGKADWKQEVVNPDGQQRAGQAGTPDRHALNDAVGRINQHMRNYNTSLHFEVDDAYGKPVIRVVDQGTEKLVRQIPCETALALGAFFDEMAEISGRGQMRGFLLQKTT